MLKSKNEETGEEIRMSENVRILDCTLRDGGLALEDANKNGLSSIKFSLQDSASVLENLNDSRVDIIEIGAIEISDDDKTGFCIFDSIESASKTAPEKKDPEQLYAVLYRGPDTPLEDIPCWRPGLCEATRVILRYSELQKSLDFCAGLASKGYKVFVQPMLTMRYSPEELELLVARSNAMGAYALYFVDSYGYMQTGDVKRLFDVYDAKLNPEIKIGFHSHNNMNLAFSNVLSFLELETQRERIVDSCLLGMGQGAGNMQTELLVGYLNNLGAKYKFENILDGCEIIERYYGSNLWGYSVARLLPALHKCAYKYSVALRSAYGFTYSEIDRLLSNMPRDLKQRYTKEDAEALVERFRDK